MKKILLLLIPATVLLWQSCKESKPAAPAEMRGEPVLIWEKPVEDANTHTFSLTLRADSTAQATVTFLLIDSGDTLMTKTGNEVVFQGIAPLEEGYDIAMHVAWGDTSIIRTAHVTGFVLAVEPIEPLTAEELQQLINNKDESLKRGSNEHLSQTLNLTITNATEVPTMLRDVIRLIDYGTWQSVVVTNVEYDDSNQIIAITLEPVGEKAEPAEDMEEVEEIELIDEDY